MGKRASAGLRQSRAVDEDAKTKFKFQNLLNEYLDLQKEHVTKKRKLQTAKKRRSTLLSEVRFLRRRHKYLSEHKVEKKTVHGQSSNTQRNISETGNDYSVREAAFANPCPVLVPHSDSRDVVVGEHERKQVEPLRIQKHKNLKIRDKILGKRKISWQDQVPLNV